MKPIILNAICSNAILLNDTWMTAEMASGKWRAIGTNAPTVTSILRKNLGLYIST